MSDTVISKRNETEESADQLLEQELTLEEDIPEEDKAQGAVIHIENPVEEDTIEECVAEENTGSARKTIYERMEESIMKSELPLKEKNERLSYLIRVREKKANILVVGATGSGKSSTINAMFNMEVATVGVGVDPETNTMDKYELDNLVIWDTPGLGDSNKSDEAYDSMIVHKLNELDQDGNPLIDLVLIVLDASSKDLGTSYRLINEVIIPALGEDREGRILIGLNQADVAMKGKHWKSGENEPDEVLIEFLDRKAESVQQRIYENTGVKIFPVYYSAGYKEEGEAQCKPYNLTKLLYYIVRSIPKDKRIALVDNLNKDEGMWEFDDGKANYKERTERDFLDALTDGIIFTAQDGADIGKDILGIPGEIVGGLVGGVFGIFVGIFDGLFG